MDRTIEFYDKRCDQYPEGEGWQCSAWYSKEYQAALFKAASMVGDLRKGNVLDVGCGLADLYDYLGQPPGYVGIDVSSKIIDRAKAARPEADLRCVDFSDYDDVHDWVVAIGAFNVVMGSPHEQLKYLRANVLRMLTKARRGVSMTFLSCRAVPPDERYKQLYYYDPVEVLEICLDLNRWVALDHISDPAQCYVLMRTG